MRDGLRVEEQHILVRETLQGIEDGLSDDAAYTAATRQVPGISPTAFASWKPSIVAQAKGEVPTEAKAKPKPGGFPGSVFKKVEQLNHEIEFLKAENAQLKDELKKLNEDVLGTGDKKPAAPAPASSKK